MKSVRPQLKANIKQQYCQLYLAGMWLILSHQLNKYQCPSAQMNLICYYFAKCAFAINLKNYLSICWCCTIINLYLKYSGYLNDLNGLVFGFMSRNHYLNLFGQVIPIYRLYYDNLKLYLSVFNALILDVLEFRMLKKSYELEQMFN